MIVPSRQSARHCVLAVLFAFMLWSVPNSIALAHALLLRATPPEGAVLPNTPARIHLWFSEDLNGSSSRIVVWDRYRHVVTEGSASLVPGQPRQMEIGLKPLAPGSYLVLWTSVSAQDGHILHGYYLFSVKARGPGPSLIGASSTAGSQTFPNASGLAALIAHWVELLAVTTWVGTAAFSSLVMPAVLDRFRPEIRDVLATRQRGLVRLALGTLFVASCVVLLLQAYSLANNSWASAFSGTTAHDIFSVQFGQLWVVRQIIVLLALAATALGAQASSRRITERGALRRGEKSGALQLVVPVSIMLGIVYLYLFAASGHAASSSVGVLMGSHIASASVAIDWLHFIGTCVWLGGQMYILFVLVPAVRADHDTAPRSSRLFLDALDRFSPIAFACVALFTLSGPFNGATHIPSWYAFFNSVYGRALIVKLALIGLMVLASAVQVFLWRPRIRRNITDGPQGAAPVDPPLLNRLLGWLRIEPALGSGVLLVTAVMFYYPVSSGFAPVDPPTYRATSGQLVASLRLTPDHSGPNQIYVTLSDKAGRPVKQAQVTVLTIMLDMVMGTGAAPLHETRPGHFSGTTDLGMGGHWRLEMLVYEPSGLTRMNVKATVGT